MFYFAVSLSSINPHQVPFPIPPTESRRLHPRFPGGNAIRCRGHFIQCHSLSARSLQSFVLKKMPLSNELHQPWWSKHLSGPLGNNSIKKRGREEVGEVKGLEGWGGNGMDREGKKILWMAIKRTPAKAWSLMTGNAQQNMYWRQSLCLLPGPLQWITQPPHPNTPPPPPPSFLIKWLLFHLSIRSSPLQRLDKGLLSVAC